jgi:hypothetical protein
VTVGGTEVHKSYKKIQFGFNYAQFSKHSLQRSVDGFFNPACNTCQVPNKRSQTNRLEVLYFSNLASHEALPEKPQKGPTWHKS